MELQTLLKERSDAFESEAQARKRLMEESELMKKLEEQNKKSESSSSGESSEAAKQAARGQVESAVADVSARLGELATGRRPSDDVVRGAVAQAMGQEVSA